MNAFYSLFLAAPAYEQVTQAVFYLLVAVILWIILRFVLRLAIRIFMTGCAFIAVIGLLYVILRYFA